MRVAIRTLAVLVVPAMIAGCSHQEFNRPLGSWIGDSFDAGLPYVEEDKSPEEIRAERLSEVLAAWESGPKPRRGDYRIGPCDVVSAEIFALESPEETSTLECTVSREGTVTLPWVGRVAAAGLTARQLEERIRAAYAGRYIKDPQVALAVKSHRSAFVTVTGAVGKAGIYYLSGNSTTLLSVLGRAGGLTKGAGEEVIVVRGGNPPSSTSFTSPEAPEPEPGRRVIRIDLNQLVKDGNLLFNVVLVHGDIVSVPARREEYVYVLGYVRSPGAVPVRGGRMDAVRAVARAGGLSPLARAENSYVVLESEDGEVRRVVDVDLTKIVRGVRPPLYLRAGDTLVVGSNVVARMAEFVRPSAGASASIATGVP